MGGVVNLSRFSIWPSVYDLTAGQASYDERLCSRFKLLVSETAPVNHNDETDPVWIEIGPFNVERSGGVKHFDFTPVQAGYFKFIALEGFPVAEPKYLVIGEVDAYVQ